MQAHSLCPTSREKYPCNMRLQVQKESFPPKFTGWSAIGQVPLLLNAVLLTDMYIFNVGAPGGFDYRWFSEITKRASRKLECPPDRIMRVVYCSYN